MRGSPPVHTGDYEKNISDINWRAMKKVENDSCQYLEEVPSTTQAGGSVGDKSEVNNNKVSTSDRQSPSTHFENMPQGMPVY